MNEQESRRTCPCGCGETPTPGSTWVRGHHMRKGAPFQEPATPGFHRDLWALMQRPGGSENRLAQTAGLSAPTIGHWRRAGGYPRARILEQCINGWDISPELAACWRAEVTTYWQDRSPRRPVRARGPGGQKCA